MGKLNKISVIIPALNEEAGIGHALRALRDEYARIKKEVEPEVEIIVVDGGSRDSTREAAAELCALIAFSAIRSNDKVGLTLFHGGIEQYIPPRKGQKHALRVVREVLAHGLDTPERQTAPRVRAGR